MSWPGDFESLVHRIQDNYQHVGNSAKADILEREIGKMCRGNDAYYIMVYNHCGGYQNHSFNAVTDQTIYSFRRGKCNVVIYRSLEWNDDRKKYRIDIEQQVESCRYGVIPDQPEYAGFPKWIMEYRVKHTSFMGMIGQWENPSIRSVNSNTEWGPGWWITATVYNKYTKKNLDKRFVLIAGWE